MSLFAYNLTGSPVALAAGSPIVTVPASAAPPARGKAYNVTAEIRPNLTVDPVNGKTGGLAASAYVLLQAQVTNGQVVFEWTSEPEYLTPGLIVSTPGDEDPNLVKQTTAVLHVYADGTFGNNANSGLQTSAGTGGSFAYLAGVVTFTGTGAAWTTADVGKLITINYATNPANNGTFQITLPVTPTTVTYANAFGVTEAMPAGGKWAVSSPKKTLAAVFALVPYKADHNVCVHLSGIFTDAGAAYLEKMVASTVTLVVDGGTATTPVSMITGFGDSFTGTGLTTTLYDAGANFTANLATKLINITGATSAANNGLFTITTVTDSTHIVITRASGSFAAGAYDGWYQVLPFDATISGTGDTLTFTPGPNTVDLVDAGASFTQADVGKQITLVGSLTPANDGTFVITTVVSATQVTFVNAAGATESFAAGTWTLGGFVANAATTTQQGLNSTAVSWKRDQYLGSIIEVLSGACAGQNRLCVGYDEPVTNNTVLTGANTTFATSVETGGNDQFTYNPTGNVVTLTDASAVFTADMVGKQIVIAGATGLGNNGTFTITYVLTPSTLTYVNATPGVTEAGAGTWTITTVTLTAAGSAFNQLLRAPSVVDQTVLGTKITILGSTTPLANDGTFIITDVISPTVIKYGNALGTAEAGAGTWTLQRNFQKIGTDVYLTDAGMELSIRVTGKVITISGSTTPANDGPFTITEWVAPNIVKYTNAGGASENFPGTWATQGWLTPSRDWPAPGPGAAQFRFVRPTTKVTAAQITVRNDGGVLPLALTLGASSAGSIYNQNLTLDAAAKIFSSMSSGVVTLSHIFSNSNATTSWPLQYASCASIQLMGNRVNPHSFAYENATTTSQVGVGTQLIILSVAPLMTIRCGNIAVQQSYLAAWINAQCQSVNVGQGTRGGCVNMFGTGIAIGSSAFGGIVNNNGYAKTRFTGSEVFQSAIPGKYNAALGLINSHIIIGTAVEFTPLPKVEIAIEMNKSYVYSNGIQIAVAQKIGLYMHSGSCWTQLESFPLMPWIRGKSIGDISMDRATRKTTWEEVNLVNITDATELSQIKRGYVGIY